MLENKFPGLHIHICCNDESIHILGNEKTLSVTMSKLRLVKTKFAHVYELLTGSEVHPIEELLNSCDIDKYAIEVPQTELTTKCVVISKGNYPTRNLTKPQISKLKGMATMQGYEIGETLEGVGWVIGVESEELFEAAGKGIKTTLVKTGIGDKLYKKMFPQGEVISI